MNRIPFILLLAHLAMPGLAAAAGNLLLVDEHGALVVDAQGMPAPIRWDLSAMPTPGRIPWDMSALGDPDGTLSLPNIERIFAASFQTWEDVPTSAAAFIPNATRCTNNDGQLAAGFDGDNLLTFTDPDSDLIFQPGLYAIAPSYALVARTVIGTVTDDRIEYVEFGGFDGVPDMREGIYPPGTILDADILFNPDIQFIDGFGPLKPKQVDLQSVATHEIGHLLGLAHSVVGEAVGTRRSNPATMFPFLHEDSAVLRSLEPDDIASVSSLYPAPAFTDFAAISGRVVNGTVPATGVMVVALPVTAERTVDSRAVFAITGLDGRYTIPGLIPGEYVISVQPFTPTNGALWKDRYNALTSQSNSLAFPQEFWDNRESATDDPNAYSILILAPGQRRADVDLRLNRFDSVIDRFELNDTLEQAVPITANTIGGITGFLSGSSDRDFYRFSAGAHSAVVVQVLAADMGVPLDTVAVLYDADGKLLAFNDNAAYSTAWGVITTSADPRIAVEDLPIRGESTDFVVEIRARNKGSSGPYRLTVRTSHTLDALLGDLTRDGIVDARDAALCIAPGKRADLDHDRIVSYRDVFRLQREWHRR